MTDQIVTLRINTDSRGGVAGVQVVRRELTGLSTDAARAGSSTSASLAAVDAVAGRMGSSFERVRGLALGALGAFAGFSSLQSVWNASLQGTISQERALAQVEARIKSTGGAAGLTAPQLAGMASSLQSVTTYADDAVSEMQALLLTFTKVSGDVFPAAQMAILNVATGMGTDLKSAAIQVGKALNDPVQGLTALSRGGVQFSDAQEATIKRMVAMGDVAAAQKVILAELETQFGGAAVAARNTFGGALQALQISFGDLFEVSDGLPELTAQIKSATAALKDPATVAAVQQLAATVLQAIPVMVNGFVAVAQHGEELLVVIAAIAGARGLGALIAAAGQARSALQTTLNFASIGAQVQALSLPIVGATSAMKAMTLAGDAWGARLLALAGGPIPAAIAALAPLALAIKQNLDELDRLERRGATVVRAPSGSIGTGLAGATRPTAAIEQDVQRLSALMDRDRGREQAMERHAASLERLRQQYMRTGGTVTEWNQLMARSTVEAAAARAASTQMGAALAELNRIGADAGTVQARQAAAATTLRTRLAELAAIEQATPGAVGEVARTRAALIAQYQREVASIGGVTAANRTIERSQREAERAESSRSQTMRRLIELTLGATAATDPAAAALDDYADSVRRYADAGGRAIEAGNDYAQVQAAVRDATEAAAAALDRSLSSIDAEAQARARAADIVGRTLESLELEARMAGLNARERTILTLTLEAEERVREQLNRGVERSSTLTDAERAAIERRAKAAMDGIDAARANEDALNSLRQTGVNVFGDLANATTDWIMRGGRDFKGFFSDVVSGFKRMLADIIAQSLRARLGQTFGSAFGLGGTGAAAAAPGVGAMGNLLGGVTSGGGVIGNLLGGTFGAVGGMLAGFGGALGGFGAGLTVAGNAGLLAAGQFGVAQLAAGNLAVGLGSLVPVIGAIAAAVGIVNQISGGRLLGTSYRAESSTSTLSLGADGGDASQTIREVRQRSLFRGRQWRNRSVDASDEAVQAASQLFDAVRKVMVEAARAMQGEAPEMISAALRTVQTFDKDGKVKATKYFVDVLGRSWEEATAEAASTRITAEGLIATIDAVLGSTVDAASNAIASTVQAAFEGADGGIRDAGSAFDVAIKSVGAAVGEASAIAERWRDDAATLMDGAQMLLAAATDIRAGTGLLGEGGSLTAITALIEDLAAEGESLAAAYARVSASTKLWEEALALSGVVVDQTREQLVRFATDITTAAGGIERAQALWTGYFSRFYSEEERRALALTRAQARQSSEFGDIGLQASDFAGADAIARFRALFEAALPTLGADAIVQWLEAGDALGAVIDLQGTYNEVLQTTVSTLGDIMSGVEEQIASFAPPQTFAQRIDAITASIDSLIKEAVRLGATEEQISRIRLLGTLRVNEVLQEQQRAMDEYSQFIAGFRNDDAGLSEFQQAVRRIERETRAASDRANELARSAGLAGAAEADLVAIQQRGAEQIAEAAAQLEASIVSLADQLGYAAAQATDATAAYGSDLGFVHWLEQQRQAIASAPVIDPERFGLANRLAAQARELAEFSGAAVTETLARLRIPFDRLVGDLGVDIERLGSPEIMDRLVQASRTLGIDVLDAARQLGRNVGELSDATSLINDAFERALERLPENVRNSLDPLFRAYEGATTAEGRASARSNLVNAIDQLPPQLRALLAPFLAEINSSALAEQQLGAAEQANRYLSVSVDHLAEIRRVLSQPTPVPAVRVGEKAGAQGSGDAAILREILLENRRLNGQVEELRSTIRRMQDNAVTGRNGVSA